MTWNTEAYRRWSKTIVGRQSLHRATHKRRSKVKQWIDGYKLRRGCVQCGFNTWPECLDFDHKNPKTKIFTISAYLTGSLVSLKKEMRKCQILCANCHRHKSKLDQGELDYIRQGLACGRTSRNLAKQFNVNERLIGKIKRGEHYESYIS